MNKMAIWRVILTVALIAFALSQEQFRELLKLVYGG